MRPLIALSLVVSVMFPVTADAAWPLDGAPLCTAAAGQHLPDIVSDGAGGAIVTWYDYRNGAADIYVQRLDALGNPLWTANGVALCTLGGDQLDPRIIADGAGGAIVTWQDARGVDYDVYAQRVNASGAPQWTADGVALCIAANNQFSPTIVSDGAGGAIVTWHDYRSGTGYYDIYAQRVNASGAPQWTADGVALCTAAKDQYTPTIVSDGAGGAIVTWYDLRNGAYSDIYAQRVNASGAPQWTADGVALCTAADHQSVPTIVSDGAGGAIVTWHDYRSGTSYYDIYAQRVNASGAPQWTADGVALCTAAFDQNTPTIVSDGGGGAIVTWHDYRSGTNHDIYAQRVSASGVPRWAANGVALCTAANEQSNPTIVSDGAGGAIVTWPDYRSGTNWDIYAQRISAAGSPLWTANGAAVSTAAGSQQSPTILANATGGVIIAWNDARKGDYDIYAQRIEPSYGTWGHPEPALYSVADVPADQGGRVRISWYPSDHDVLHLQEITHYSIWRAVEALPVAVEAGAATDSPRAVRLEDVTAEFSERAYRVQPSPAGDYFWEFVGNQTAHYFPGYSYAAATSYDSIVGNPAVHTFQVVAHTSNQFVVYPSAPASGYSVDNLAPAAPLSLTAQRVGSDVHLTWNRAVAPDLRDYSIYRATSTGVTPVPLNFLSSSEDTIAVDANAPTPALYYIVTAHDVHANQSPPSNEASVGATTGVGNTPPITALAVLDNMPNPFTGTTTLRVGLPRATEVEIEVFDVAGRRVKSDRTTTLAAGWREIAFEARDPMGQALPSGVYFYRIKAAGETITRKMVIAR